MLLINLIALPLLIVFFIFFSWLANSLLDLGKSISFDLDLIAIVKGIIFFFLLLIIHEGIHGLFFKIFNPKAKVKFGYLKGMLYATSPDSKYKLGQWLIIGLSPFVLITAGLTVALMLGLSPFAYIIFASLHAAGCMGDFYFSILSIKAPRGAYFEDHRSGFRILIEN